MLSEGAQGSAGPTATAGFDADVVVVGQGPTGAALAAFLGELGVRTIALERDGEVRRVPRARMVDGEIMRVFQTFGLADRLEERFLPAPEFRYESAAGELLALLELNSGPRPNLWRNAYMIHQPDVDEALMEKVAALPSVTVLRGREVKAVEELGEGVAVTVSDAASGEESRLRCRYVVGCEGGRSLVRRAIGARNEVLGEDLDWLFVDVELQRDVDLAEHNYYILDPARTVAYLRNPRRYRRFYFRLRPGEDPEAMASEASLWELLSPWLAEGDAKIVFSTVFRFHSLLADRWRRGPLLIAGDAAHQMAPTLGQGLCSGVRDAANLSWKLARVLAGQAPESLLDTYQSERSPHARLLIETSYMLASWWSLLDPEEAAKRDEVLRSAPIPALELRLGPGLHPEGDEDAGALFPQDLLADGRPLDDSVGIGFALIDSDGLLAEAGAEARELVADLGAAVIVAPGPEASRWLAERGARAAVVRPDRYVLGVAADGDQLTEVLRRVPGRAATATNFDDGRLQPAENPPLKEIHRIG